MRRPTREHDSALCNLFMGPDVLCRGRGAQMAGSVSNQKLLEVLDAVAKGKPGLFRRWASRHARLGVWQANADAAEVLVGVYGGTLTLQALAAAGLERIYVDDLSSVVGARRSANIVALIDLKSGRVRRQPVRKFGLLAGRIAFAFACVIALWIAASEETPSGAATDVNEQVAPAAAMVGVPALDEQGGESTERLPSCAVYSVFMTQLACTSHVESRLQSQNISMSDEAREAERKMFAAANSYPASAECREFTEQVMGMTVGQIDAATADYFGRPVAHEDIVNTCSDTYGAVVAGLCGSMPGGCESVIPSH